MGLTNNTIVKAGVDLLITLLNTVNSLTSAFGEGAGSIAKWVLAIGSLRGMASLFKNGGLVSKLLSNSFLGNALNIAGAAGTGTTVAAGSTGIAKLWGGAKNLGTALYGIGNNGAAGGAGWLFGGSATSGLAGLGAGLAGILTALTAIGVAIGVVVAGYKLWLKYTPEG